MKVIVPVAGAGSRLRPHTFTQPKALLPVADKPVLGHVLDHLVSVGPQEVILVVGHRGEEIEEYVRAEYSLNTRFVRQQDLLGLGYAVKMALAEASRDPVLIVLGDTIVECDLKAFVTAGPNVLGVRRVGDPKRFGIAEVRDGSVVRLVEKPNSPPSDLALVGLYYVTDPELLRSQLDGLVARGGLTKGEYQLTDALQGMIDNGVNFVPYEIEGWYDCGKPETLLSTNRHLLDRLPVPQPPEGSVIIPPVYIAPSARVSNAILGPYVSILHEATVTNSIVQDSILFSGSTVENACLEGSLVGRYAIVRGSSTTVNVGERSRAGIS